MANQKISFYLAQSCSICHLELLSKQMAAFPSTILNSCPIRGNLPPHLSWHRTLTSTLLAMRGKGIFVQYQNVFSQEPLREALSLTLDVVGCPVTTCGSVGPGNKWADFGCLGLANFICEKTGNLILSKLLHFRR